jgi:hypothetical protein
MSTVTEDPPTGGGRGRNERVSLFAQAANFTNRVSTPIVSLVSIGAVSASVGTMVLAGLSAYVLVVLAALYFGGR